MLADYGIGPGSSPGVLVDRYEVPHTGASKAGQDYSELGVWDNPGVAGPFTGRTASSTATKDVSDTASLSATESPIDTNEIVTYDSANLTATELAGLLDHYGVTDLASLTLNESIALNITGVLNIPITDTASLTLTESTALGITIDVTDGASLTLTESATVAVATEVLDVTDDAALAANDFATLDVFSGGAAFTVSDTVLLQDTESAGVVPIIDTVVENIKFQARVPSIRFRKL